MKKLQTYLVLLLVLLNSGVLEAKVSNYLGATMQVADWSLLPAQSPYSTSFGPVGGVGFVYELQAGKKYSETQFLFDLGVGAWGGMTAYIQGSSRRVELKDQLDLNGDLFDYIYEIGDRRDYYTNVAVQVPVLIGFQHRAFYMLAGVKFDASVFTKSHIKIDYSTYGKYKNFGIIGQDPAMPEYQFFANEQLRQKADASLKMNMAISVELGGRFGFMTSDIGYDVPKRKVECRFAGFIDYGIGDIHVTRGLEPIVTPQLYDVNPSSANYVWNTRTMVDNIELNDLMSTNGFASKVNSLQIGLKFTVLFQLPETQRCLLCYDAYKSLVRPRGSSRSMKYEE